MRSKIFQKILNRDSKRVGDEMVKNIIKTWGPYLKEAMRREMKSFEFDWQLILKTIF